MKKANITVSFEQEKLKALQFYAGKKEASLQGELDDFLQKLYEKYVPAQTREYIESMAEDERPAPARAPRPRQTPLPASPDPSRPQPEA